MSSLLSNMAYEIASYIDLTAMTLEGVFNLFASTGAILLQVVAFLATSLWTAISHFFTVSIIFLNDFCLFLVDVYNLSDELLSFLTFGVNQVISSTMTFLNHIQHFAIESHHMLYSSFESLCLLLLAFLQSVKALLILVGDSTIFLLQLGPSSVLAVTTGAISFAREAVYILYYYFSCLSQCINTIFTSLRDELTDIQPLSLLGIFVAIIIAITLRIYVKSVNWVVLRRNVKTIIKDWLRRHRRPSSDRNPSTATRSNESSSIINEATTSSSLKKGQLSKSHLLRQLEQEREDKLCVVCQDQNKCVILLPCRHYCLCQICMQRLSDTDPVCPICRQFVLDHLRIYG